MALGVVVLAAGIGLAIVGGGGSVLFVIGLACAGLGAVALTALVFWVIGRSEDAYRERHPSG